MSATPISPASDVTAALASLNPAQQAAAAHVTGPALVLAGAGAGKTKLLTTRVAQLIGAGHVAPSGLMCVTFTNKAAGEMRERISQLVGTDAARRMMVGTFHRLGLEILKRDGAAVGLSPRFSILDADDQEKLWKTLCKELPAGVGRRPRDVQHLVSLAKNRREGPAALVRTQRRKGDDAADALGVLYAAYVARCAELGSVDFDDLLVQSLAVLEQDATARSYWQSRATYLMVDEYQDTNDLQYALLQQLAARTQNMLVVGDDDQAIYGWRGASVAHIHRFQSDYPGAAVFRLEQNYRSTARILRAANAAIAPNEDRLGKTLWTERGDGAAIVVADCQSDHTEARWIAASIARELRGTPGRTANDIAILYRTGAQSRLIEQALAKRNQPYRLVGGVPFFERREIKDILSYLRLATNPDHDLACQRALSVVKRGVGEKALTTLRDWATTQGIATWYGSLKQAELCPDLSPRARTGIASFVADMAWLEAHLLSESAERALRRFYDKLDVNALYGSEEDGAERLENLTQLLAQAAEFADEQRRDGPGLDTLGDFMQQLTLLTSADTRDDGEPKVTLMTLHAAKGLEFPVVFLAGVEEQLLPHARHHEDAEGLAEERRLFYVGLTRAETRLAISFSRDRRFGPGDGPPRPSPFLTPLPMADLERVTVRTEADGLWRPTGGASVEPEHQAPQTRRLSGLQLGSMLQGDTDAPTPALDPQAALAVNDVVVHPTYGSGTVIASFGASVIVQFTGVGKRPCPAHTLTKRTAKRLP